MRRNSDLMLIVQINEQIKKVVSFAQRINLLALNAILCSRKAGEVAVGFGVISTELRVFSKDLTGSMHSLSCLSYQSVERISLWQKYQRNNRLIVATNQLAKQGSSIPCFARFKNNFDLLQGEVATEHRNMMNRVSEAQQLVRFGTVIARSLKIEATYGGGAKSNLSQIAAEFDILIESVSSILQTLISDLRRNELH